MLHEIIINKLNEKTSKCLNHKNYVFNNSKVVRNIGNFNVYNESKRIKSKQKHAAYC